MARYSFLSAKNNGFEAGDYDTQGSPILSTHNTLFEIDSLLQIGTDTHFKEFVYNFDMIVEGLRHILPPKGGYAGTEASARREFKENIYRWYNSLKGKGLLK